MRQLQHHTSPHHRHIRAPPRTTQHQQNTSHTPARPDFETGSATPIAIVSIIGTILVLCIVVHVVLSIRARFCTQERADDEEAGTDTNHPDQGSKEQRMDPCLLLNKFKITLTAANFNSKDETFVASQHSKKKKSSVSVLVEHGSDVEMTKVSTSMNGIGSDATCSVGTNETTDEEDSDSNMDIPNPEEVLNHDVVVSGPKETNDDDTVNLDPEEATRYITLPISGGAKSRQVNDLCAICLSSYDLDETVVCLPLCGHAYHYECLLQVVPRDSKCPLCRLDFTNSSTTEASPLGGTTHDGLLSQEDASRREETGEAPHGDVEALTA